MNLVEKTSRLGPAAGVLAISILAFSSGAQELQLPAALSLQATPAILSGGESGKLRITALRDTRMTAQSIPFKVQSDDPALLRFRISEGTIPETQNAIDVEFGTAATPVAKTVRVRVAYGDSKTTEALVNLVPALLSRASCTPSTLYGTKGNTVSCTAELKAPAPVGGILIHVSPMTLTPKATVRNPDPLTLTNPAIPAGSRTGSVQIQYNSLIAAYSDFDTAITIFSPTFEAQNRRVDLVLALEPQGKPVWDPIPDRAIKTGFDLVPLRPASFSVQPSTISLTAEGTATFVLNAPAGSNESVIIRSGNGNAARLTAANGVCAAATAGNVDMDLVAGTATQTFKVCARPVSAPTTSELTIYMRSGDYDASVAVNP